MICFLEDIAYFAEQPCESTSDSPEASSSCLSDPSDSDSDSDFDDDPDSDTFSVPSSSDCDSQSEDGNDKPEVEVVSVKAARGVWGQAHVFDGKLYLTRDICKDEQIPKQLKVPVKSKPAKPAAKRAGKQAAQSASASSSNPQPVPELPCPGVQGYLVL